jgi:neutral ceramidase
MKTVAMVLLFTAHLYGASLKAGVGKANITPAGPIWMSGYAARTHASEGVLAPLWAKALAIESAGGGRIVIVTVDVVGIPRDVADEVAAAAGKQFGVRRSELLLNASHTHTGPMIWPNLANMVVLPAEEKQKLIEYRAKFTAGLVSAIGDALRTLAPATISYARGSVDFAVNRRQASNGSIKIGVNPNGPVDHSVPVLKIADTDGNIRAILFGYACHNTTLTAEFYQLSGDYAGFASAALEQQHPGATALFMMLCGADQNPNPRSTLELARQHGAELASEVDRVLSGAMTPISGPVRTNFRIAELKLAPRTREDLEAELQSGNGAYARRAGLMLNALAKGQRIDRIDYPVQAVRFGKSLTVLALGGEVTVEYALRVNREYPGEPVITAGYSNDVMCYIPSARILHEGGYEAVDSMAYYGQAGPFAGDVEERIFAAIHRVMRAVGR